MELLRPAANDVLQKWPVSKRVNSFRAPGDDPTLIERIAVEAGQSQRARARSMTC